jgi:hypothetical protein
MLLKVKDSSSLVRDSESKAILNTNLGSLESYRKKRSAHVDMINAIEDINTLKNELLEIKSLLKFIVDQNQYK